MAPDGLVPLAGLVIAGLAAGQALQEDEQEDEAQQQGRELGRRRRVAQPVPGAEDAGGEGGDAEELDGAIVRQGLHQGQGEAGDDGGPRQGQGDGEKGPPGAVAQGAADVQHAQGLAEEGGPGQQVDVGVEHQGQHHHRPRQGADLGEPVVAVAPAKPAAQGRLHGAGEVQQAGVGVGDDVGRHGHGQQQGPLEQAPAGEAAHADQPGGAHAADQGPHRHPQHQPEGIDHIVLEHRRRQVFPDLPGGDEQEAEHYQHRQGERQSQSRHPQGPGARAGTWGLSRGQGQHREAS